MKLFQHEIIVNMNISGFTVHEIKLKAIVTTYKSVTKASYMK